MFPLLFLQGDSLSTLIWVPVKFFEGLTGMCTHDEPWDFHNRYKDGKLIKDNHTCYEPEPLKYRLGIRDVRPKHAGNYTIVLSNAKYGLYKNLTMQLVVTGKALMFIVTSVKFFLFFFCAILFYRSAGRSDKSPCLADWSSYKVAHRLASYLGTTEAPSHLTPC